MWMEAQRIMDELLRCLVAEGRERGIQVAVYLNGQLVIDAWAGFADPATGREVDGDTLFPVFSTTKGIAATLVHRLVEQGRLGYETRIGDIWPEFRVNGKEGITVEDALWHTAALPYMPEDIGIADLHDWCRMCHAIARMKPAWPPATRAEYHAVTFGWIIGEILRRVDGRPFGQQVQEVICRPLGLTGMFVGIPEAVESRIALLEEIFDKPDVPAVPSVGPQAIPSWMMPLHHWMNTAQARRACLPASNGIMTARAIAKHYAALLPGGVEGTELLPPQRVRLATQWQKPSQPWEPDRYPTRVGGYALCREVRLLDPAFGHGGYGGSIGFADPKHRLAVGLTKNLFSKAGAETMIIDELYRVLQLNVDRK